MAQNFLCYAPEDDKRPDPLSPVVLQRATNARIEEIQAWLKPRLPTLSEEETRFALAAAMKRGGADGFRTSYHLKSEFGWPVDMDLCCLVRDTCNALAFALRVETRAWAVRTGLRFPASCNDQIEWVDLQNTRYVGSVVSIDASYAAAIVQPSEGLRGRPQARRVFAEQVVGNVTKGEYAVYQFPLPDKAANSPEV